MGKVVDTANIEQQQGLGADLLAVVARLNRLATQRIQMPLPAAQARLLATIEVHGEARIGDLAAVDHCSQPTMTTQVRRLEDAGLVSRTVDPGDARAVRIRITPDGRRTLNAVRADRAAAIEPQLAQLEPEDRRVLGDAIEVLRRLVDNAAVVRRNPVSSARP
jgi:DNA-binding MarR family transcriptional regulator